MSENNGNRLEKIREMQLVQLELIKIFVDICEKENLRYYMLGGTMLGAIRHKGYIPWDDDADFGMPRPDYEKFLIIADKYLFGSYALETNVDNVSMPQYQARLTSGDFKLYIDQSKVSRVENTWIDIFPLDGMPNGKLFHKLHKFRLLARRALYQFSYFDEYVNADKPNRVWYEKVLIFFGKHFPIEKILSKSKERIRLDKALKSSEYEHSDYLLNMMGAYKFKELFHKDVFGDGAEYEFEGLQLIGPQDYEFYLTQMYGDYMIPPPESERNKHGTEFVEN